MQRASSIAGVFPGAQEVYVQKQLPKPRVLTHSATVLAIPDQHNPQSSLQPKEALQLTKLMIDRTAEATFWVGSDAQLVYVNDAASRSLEYSRTELLAMTIHDINPSLPQSLWSKHWQTLRQQGVLIFESCHRAREGQVFPVEISVVYIEFQDREYSCAFARDITKRKQTEVALQEANEALTAAKLEKQAALRQGCAAESQQVSKPASADFAKPATPKSIFPSVPHLSAVFDFIEANYHQPVGLCDVAQAVGYSPAYLTDLVRRQTGQPLHRWIVKRRMAAACSLLLETSQTVDQIAEAVGYQYAGCFFRQFRQHHGTTPQAWRNAQRTQGSTS